MRDRAGVSALEFRPDLDLVKTAALQYRPHWLADIVGKVWALPNTVFGLLLGAIATILGARPCVGHNALQFTRVPRFLLFGSTAATSGNVILYAAGTQPEDFVIADEGCVPIGWHEEAHTYQCQVLGPLFGLIYLLLGGGARASNPLERSANRYARGHGSWWPLP